MPRIFTPASNPAGPPPTTPAPTIPPGLSPALAVYAKLTLVSVIWGGTFVAGRFLAGDLPPLLLASLRFVISSGGLALYLAISGTRLICPDRRQLARLAVLGGFGIYLYNLCFFAGLHFTTASRASLIVAMNPAGIALASRWITGERLSPARLLGIGLCIAGAGVVIVARADGGLGSGVGLGDLLILGCVVSWVVYSVGSAATTRALGPMLTVTYSIWLGTAMLCATTALATPMAEIGAFIGGLGAAQWGGLFYLGALGSAIAYILYYDAIAKVGATRSGAFIALNPLTAVVLGSLWFGERLTPLIGAGGILVLLGLYLCNRPKRG